MGSSRSDRRLDENIVDECVCKEEGSKKRGSFDARKIPKTRVSCNRGGGKLGEGEESWSKQAADRKSQSQSRQKVGRKLCWKWQYLTTPKAKDCNNDMKEGLQ